MPIEDYSLLPSFSLYDNCLLGDYRIKNEFIEAVMYTSIDLSIASNGKFIAKQNKYGSFILSLNEYRIKHGSFNSTEACQIYLKKHNVSEYKKILDYETDWHLDLKDISNTQFAQNIKSYFIIVRKKFENWFVNQNIPIPNINKQKKSKKKNTSDLSVKSKTIQKLNSKRLNLPRGKREELNSKIVEAVEIFIDEGRGSLEQAFHHLSQTSLEKFGYDLSPKALEGRYSRNKERKSSYK